MGLFVKKNHGKEYLYSLAGKKQFFLGRKDDPNGINQENLHKAILIIDESLDKQIRKYLKELNEHASYMLTHEKNQYLKKRKMKLSSMLKKIDVN